LVLLPPSEGGTTVRQLSSRGFTLVELLVVIAIIGLLMPAVESARETGRRAQCASHLKQVALGFLNHESTQGFLPTGGWGNDWMGDPNRGFTKSQPGGWGFNILPDIDQDGLWQLCINPTGGAVMGSSSQALQAKIVWATPIPIYNCPTRRHLGTGPNKGNYSFKPSGVSPSQMFRADYAVNLGGWGDFGGYQTENGSPPNYATVDAMTDAQFDAACNDSYFDGICFRHSQVTLAAITDGASCTYMVCEKYLDPDHYYDGVSIGDDQGAFMGFDRDLARQADPGDPPLQDRAGLDLSTCFGSAHATGWNASFCDGSVHMMSYSIDLTTHQNLASRNDGNAINTSGF
jgi:prepilin-type N-terminal cleavage/methylation domain-containing protein